MITKIINDVHHSFFAEECTLDNGFRIGLIPETNCTEVYYYQNMRTLPLLLDCPDGGRINIAPSVCDCVNNSSFTACPVS